MSYSSRTTPQSSASQGRIVAEKAPLSPILRGNSNVQFAPAHRTESVESPALDVVSSNLDVVNVPNATTNSESKQNLQYHVVSKSSTSLITATNTEHKLIREYNHSDSPEESGSVDILGQRVENTVSQHSNRSNVYAYHSLKSKNNSDLRSDFPRSHSKHSFTGENITRSGDLHGSGHELTQECVEYDVIGSSDTNYNYYVNSRSESQFEGSGTSEKEHNIAPENSDKHIARETSDRQSTLHERQHTLHGKQYTREHSLIAQQNTGLSLGSQYDRVSRGRTPLRVNTQDQIVPPLDLSGFEIAEPLQLTASITPESPDSFKDQNLHASDQNNSIVHFSTRDYHPTVRRTYEVESPVLSSHLPYVKSSDNFRLQEDEQEDTYRDRREEPQGIEPNRSDLADDLKVPYPFDTQAARGTDSAREPQAPSPPVQTTPPPNKEPATSLRNNSNIYTVANPEVLHAQSIEPLSDAQYNPRQYSGSEGRKTAHSEVRFNSASRQPPSLDNRTYGRSPVKDRAPTPYAPSPEREDPPRSPADWEVSKESKSREKSSTSKRTLPPQHPPLDTLHNTPKPGSRGTKDDNQSIKRVYVESPSFTKEEEEEYRFVSSRLEEVDERKQETVRAMEPTQRGYGGDDNPSNGQSYANSRSRKRDENARDGYSDSRSRKTGSDYSDRRRTYDKDRYEDRNQERYEDKGQGQQHYKDTEDRHQDMNQVYYEEQRNKDRRMGSEKYSDRMKHTDGYDEPDRYERLRDERNEYEREARRENEPDYQDSYKKQNTETDDKDLKQEAEYQIDLKRRIDKQSVKIKNKSDRYADESRYENEKGYEKENEYRRDSLEYPAENRDMGYMRDSLDYDQQQQDWENPPQNPYQDNPAYYPGDYTKQDSRPDFYDPEDVERMDIVNPKAPKYDYIEHNKLDYGKNPMKSYRDIVHRKREEEEKLDHVFITPKVPSKQTKKTHQKAQSAQPVHMGYQAPPQYPVGFKPSSAEELWALKARVLTEKKGSAGNGKPARGSANKAVPKWNTSPQVKKVHKYEVPAPLPNQGQMYKPTGSYQPGSAQDQGGYSQTQGGYSTPTHQLQPLDNRPTAPVSTEMVPTAVKPSSPFRRHLELKPISQEIITEEGQRISVDINLRLISPTLGQSGVESPNQQHQQALVPVQETQGPIIDSRVVGVPYQMQAGYGGYDVYNPGYAEVSPSLYTCIYISDSSPEILLGA